MFIIQHGRSRPIGVFHFQEIRQDGGVYQKTYWIYTEQEKVLGL